MMIIEILLIIRTVITIEIIIIIPITITNSTVML